MAKQKKNISNNSLVLAEVKAVISREITDVALRSTVWGKIEQRVKFVRMREIFDSYLQEYKLRSLEPADVYDVKKMMSDVFPQESVSIFPVAEENCLKVSVELPEGTLDGRFTVEPEEPKLPKPVYVAFPVCLTADPGLVWEMGRQELASEAEARIALNGIEDEFWSSKKGLKLLKMNVPRTFAEFIERVTASKLTEKGLKRHYKQPGVLKAVDEGMEARVAA
jgi:hypothetical protein